MAGVFVKGTANVKLRDGVVRDDIAPKKSPASSGEGGAFLRQGDSPLGPMFQPVPVSSSGKKFAPEECVCPNFVPTIVREFGALLPA
jgi:hypothetical protein